MTTKELWCLAFSFFLAFILSMSTTPLAERVAYLIGAVDVPKDSRRMHKHPIPRCGGLAIIFGFVASLLCFGIPSRGMTAVMIGASIIAVMGIIDDCKNLDAKLKFIIQIIAALIVVYGGNYRISAITNPNVFSDNAYIVFPWWLSGLVSIVWIVFITNAVNFIDGLDGLAAGVSAIMSISLMIIGIQVGDYSVAVSAAALMGACFGFLPFNFNPAKVFMGDTGSTFLGFILASLSIQGVFKSFAIISFAVPMLILGLPLFDALFAMIRRILKGQSPMTADRGHFHHRLIDMGFSQKQTVFILYTISAVLGISAVLLADFGTIFALMVLVIVTLLLIFESATGGFFKKILKKNKEKENEKD